PKILRTCCDKETQEVDDGRTIVGVRLRGGLRSSLFPRADIGEGGGSEASTKRESRSFEKPRSRTVPRKGKRDLLTRRVGFGSKTGHTPAIPITGTCKRTAAKNTSELICKAIYCPECFCRFMICRPRLPNNNRSGSSWLLRKRFQPRLTRTTA